jgi:hypothetical protein
VHGYNSLATNLSTPKRSQLNQQEHAVIAKSTKADLLELVLSEIAGRGYAMTFVSVEKNAEWPYVTDALERLIDSIIADIARLNDQGLTAL